MNSELGQLDFTGTYDTSKGGVGAVDLNIGAAVVKFYAKQVIVPFKSEESGRPVYRQADYVRVDFPGEHDTIDREATTADKRRYAKHWEAYQSGRMELPDGTPLASLFPANPEIVDELRFHKVFTIEQLGGMSDTALQNIPMGGTEWHARAKRFLDMTRDAGRMGQIERRQRDLDAQVTKANEDNDALRARLAAMEEAERRRLLSLGSYVPQTDETDALRRRVAELEAEKAAEAASLEDLLAARGEARDGDGEPELHKTGSGVPKAAKNRG